MSLSPKRSEPEAPAPDTRAESSLAAGPARRYPLRVVAFQPTPVPLIHGDDGVIRIVGTRVPLDTIVSAFRAGATPEEITQQYTTVSLEAAYAVIAWFLRNTAQVDEYLAGRAVISAAIRAECEARHPPEGIRARLLARRVDVPESGAKCRYSTEPDGSKLER